MFDILSPLVRCMKKGVKQPEKKVTNKSC